MIERITFGAIAAMIAITTGACSNETGDGSQESDVTGGRKEVVELTDFSSSESRLSGPVATIKVRWSSPKAQAAMNLRVTTVDTLKPKLAFVGAPGGAKVASTALAPQTANGQTSIGRFIENPVSGEYTFELSGIQAADKFTTIVKVEVTPIEKR
jgi:hypothetical protein